MAEPKEYKRIVFHGKYGNFLSVYSLVYDTFRTRPGSKFIQVKTDHTFFYVRSGCGVLHIRSKTYSLTAGDLFYVPPDVPVVYYPDSRDPWAYYVLHINDDFGGELAALMGFTDTAAVRTSKLPHFTDQLFDSLFTPEHPSAELYHQFLSTMLQVLAILRTKEEPREDASKNSGTVEKIKAIIRLNYKSPDFSIDIIPQMLYISHTHMCRLFKAEMGMTPVAYLTDIRLTQAAELLQKENTALRQLSEAVGFSDELYFMKCFKKKYGMTVRQYRRQYQNS